MLGYNDTILDKCLPVKNFVNDVITGTSPHAEGNFLERHKEEIRKANPGSRYMFWARLKSSFHVL